MCSICVLVLCSALRHGARAAAVCAPSSLAAAPGGLAAETACALRSGLAPAAGRVAGEDIMKAERDRSSVGACTCGRVDRDVEVAALECNAGVDGAAHPLRGGSGDGVARASEEAPCGRIEMIVGPMFAGKSTELMRRIRRHELAYRRCVVIKYAKDQRHGEGETQLATHDNHRIRAVPCTKLSEAWSHARDSDVIGVDEAQFYPDLIQFCDEMADAGKIVILAALDGVCACACVRACACDERGCENPTWTTVSGFPA